MISSIILDDCPGPARLGPRRGVASSRNFEVDILCGETHAMADEIPGLFGFLAGKGAGRQACFFTRSEDHRMLSCLPSLFVKLLRLAINLFRV